jgi:hypothetical protein
LFRANADGASGDHEFAVFVAVLGDGFLKMKKTASTPLFLPRLSGACGEGQNFAGSHRTVVLIVLLGVKACTSARFSVRSACG